MEKGQRVSHKVFGEGIIRDIEKAQGYRLKIKFEKSSVGEKTLFILMLISYDAFIKVKNEF